ncbi:hypothetical protein [Chryseobacterium lactis]|uniref:hypothetical protein n=1 Tax=Chryseobacterium lactis TaxID=1241981 RepID=UPI0016287328|nr:hypothetical protein [Chryseobacterium lactis]
MFETILIATNTRIKEKIRAFVAKNKRSSYSKSSIFLRSKNIGIIRKPFAPLRFPTYLKYPFTEHPSKPTRFSFIKTLFSITFLSHFKILYEESSFNTNPGLKNFILSEIVLFLLDDGNQITVFGHDLSAQKE